MKIQDLTNEQADKWCALAQGWVLSEHLRDCWMTPTKDGMEHLRDLVKAYTPTTNPAQWAELIERFEVEVTRPNGDVWQAVARPWERHCHGEAPTPGRAVVNAVIASVYGDEVDE